MFIKKNYWPRNDNIFLQGCGGTLNGGYPFAGTSRWSIIGDSLKGIYITVSDFKVSYTLSFV